MKKRIAFLLMFAIGAGSLAGCTGSQQSKETAEKKTEAISETTAKSAEQSASDPVDIKIWHDGDESIMQTIADRVNTELSDDQITVEFEKKRTCRISLNFMEMTRKTVRICIFMHMMSWEHLLPWIFCLRLMM